jgi:LuxR family transcriptional regulator, maltose regulon positive regulatory protein
MMVQATPTVQFDTLRYQHNGQEQLLTVGTPAWYAWLTTATTFAFVTDYATFTARKEQSGNRRGNWYWRAYRRQEGKLRRAYLGQSNDVTLERLNQIAQVLISADGVDAHPEKRSRSTVGGRRDLLLATKLTMPLPRPHLVRRPRLTHKLQRGSVGVLTLISAPAGFGKSTLLVDWLLCTDRDGTYCPDQ